MHVIGKSTSPAKLNGFRFKIETVGDCLPKGFVSADWLYVCIGRMETWNFFIFVFKLLHDLDPLMTS